MATDPNMPTTPEPAAEPTAPPMEAPTPGGDVDIPAPQPDSTMG